MAKRAAKKEVLVVASKIKAYIRGKTQTLCFMALYLPPFLYKKAGDETEAWGEEDEGDGG